MAVSPLVMVRFEKSKLWHTQENNVLLVSLHIPRGFVSYYCSHLLLHTIAVPALPSSHSVSAQVLIPCYSKYCATWSNIHNNVLSAFSNIFLSEYFFIIIQGLGAAPGSASLSAGQKRILEEKEKERLAKEKAEKEKAEREKAERERRERERKV